MVIQYAAMQLWMLISSPPPPTTRTQAVCGKPVYCGVADVMQEELVGNANDISALHIECVCGDGWCVLSSGVVYVIRRTTPYTH